MTYNPVLKDPSQWTAAEKEYALAKAQQDALRLLDKISGTDIYRALVARELAKVANAKFAPPTNPEPSHGQPSSDEGSQW